MVAVGRRGVQPAGRSTAGVGLGKTHLLEGIGHALRARRPGLQVIHVTAEAFTNGFLDAMRARHPGRRSGPVPRGRRADRRRRPLPGRQAGHAGRVPAHVQRPDRRGACRSSWRPTSTRRRIAKLTDELATRFLGGMVVKLEAPDLADPPGDPQGQGRRAGRRRPRGRHRLRRRAPPRQRPRAGRGAAQPDRARRPDRQAARPGPGQDRPARHDPPHGAGRRPARRRAGRLPALPDRRRDPEVRRPGPGRSPTPGCSPCTWPASTPAPPTARSAATSAAGTTRRSSRPRRRSPAGSATRRNALLAGFETVADVLGPPSNGPSGPDGRGRPRGISPTRPCARPGDRLESRGRNDATAAPNGFRRL